MKGQNQEKICCSYYIVSNDEEIGVSSYVVPHDWVAEVSDLGSFVRKLILAQSFVQSSLRGHMSLD